MVVVVVVTATRIHALASSVVTGTQVRVYGENLAGSGAPPATVYLKKGKKLESLIPLVAVTIPSPWSHNSFLNSIEKVSAFSAWHSKEERSHRGFQVLVVHNSVNFFKLTTTMMGCASDFEPFSNNKI